MAPGFRLQDMILAIARRSGWVCTAALAGAQSSAPPSVELSDLTKPEARLSTSLEGLRGEVGYALFERRVEIRWFYRSSDDEPQLAFQNVAVSGWPTEVAGFADDLLLVAQKDPSTGQHFVELWLFDPPSALPAPRIDPATGTPVTPTIQVEVKRRTKIFTAPAAHGPIRVLLRRHGTDDDVFVQFFDQRDLFSLDTSDGTLTKMLTILPDGDLPQVPELADAAKARWARKHSVEGYVYFLGDLEGGAGLVLLDNVGLDGVLDEYGPLDLATFRARGLQNAALFEAYY